VEAGEGGGVGNEECAGRGEEGDAVVVDVLETASPPFPLSPFPTHLCPPPSAPLIPPIPGQGGRSPEIPPCLPHSHTFRAHLEQNGGGGEGLGGNSSRAVVLRGPGWHGRKTERREAKGRGRGRKVVGGVKRYRRGGGN